MDSGDNTRSARLRRLQALREEQEKLEAELHPAHGPLPSEWPARGASSHVATRADVSSRVLAPFLEALTARGGHPRELLQGLRIAASDVSDPVEWLSWEEFCVLSGNLVQAFPGDSLETTGRRVLLHPDIHRLAPLAEVLEDPVALYEFAGHRLFGSAGLLFRCVRFELRVERAGLIHMNVTLPEGYRHNPVFFRLLAEWLAALAGVRGGTPAAVSMQAIVGGAAYAIQVDEKDYLARREASKPATTEACVERLLEVQRLLRERNCELERHDLEREADFRELREAQTRFRILSELTNDYCFLAQRAESGLSCKWITGSYARITGYGSGELLRMGVHGIVHSDDRQNLTQAIEAVSRGESVQHEYRILTRQGELRWVREHLRPEVLVDGAVGAIYGAVRDVTAWHMAQREQEGLEEQLRQSQKMDAVGRLAGGIAHDFNNLLTVVLTQVGFLLSDLRENTQQHDDAIDIQQAARRAAGLTQRLLTFSRQQVILPTLLELNKVIRDIEPMLNSLVGEGIELDIQLDPQQSCISMDRVQLEQILLNLVVNARDAMEQAGGRVTIATGELDLGAAFVKAHPNAIPGRHVALAVRDTGCGMDERTVHRIFEPFFSTKAPDRGTGLGLSTVYGIVRQARGSIDVESRPGFGTTFEIYFPVAEGVATHKPSVRPKAQVSHHQETILVVEDEEGVRRGVQRILKHAGYQVLLAADPAQAIAVVEEYEGQLDLLLTDVVMPMMNGVQLAERVKAMRPDIHVLYMSGYTSDSVDTGAVLDDEIAFVHKPFTRQAMLAKVAEVLSQPQPSPSVRGSEQASG